MKSTTSFLIVASVIAARITVWGITRRPTLTHSDRVPHSIKKQSACRVLVGVQASQSTQAKIQSPKGSTKQSPIKKPATKTADTPMQLLDPTPGLLQGSTVQISLVNPVLGHLVYSAFGYANPYSTSLVVCSLNAGRDKTDATLHNETAPGLSCQTYPVKKSENYRKYVAYGVRFSPNGRYILFKFGATGSTAGGTKLFVLDTQTHELKLMPITIGYDEVAWAPDNQYIACVEGGDMYGNPYFQAGSENIYLPLSLRVCNWHTGETQLVVANDTIHGPFSWIAQHSLLYGVLSLKNQKILAEEWTRQAQPETSSQPKKTRTDSEQKSGKPIKKSPSPQPDIYIFSPEDGKSKLIIKDGYLPLASPNGQWIAFFGSEHPEQPYPLQPSWQGSSKGASLCIAHPDGTMRKALNRESGSYPILCWLPDNRHLLDIKEVQSKPVERIQIKEWDIETGHWRQVGIIEAKDRDPEQVPGLDAHFHLLGVSQDGHSLYVVVTEFGNSEGSGSFISGEGHLQAINLKTGAIQSIANLKGDSGIDWHEDPAPSTTVLKTP